jgi:hypothetical protein
MGWTGMYLPSHGDKKRWLLEEFKGVRYELIGEENA